MKVLIRLTYLTYCLTISWNLTCEPNHGIMEFVKYTKYLLLKPTKHSTADYSDSKLCSITGGHVPTKRANSQIVSWSTFKSFTVQYNRLHMSLRIMEELSIHLLENVIQCLIVVVVLDSFISSRYAFVAKQQRIMHHEPWSDSYCMAFLFMA